MQTNLTPQRQSQSSHAPSDSYRSQNTNMDTAQVSASQTRSSSGSARAHGSRTNNPDKQISQIEKSVTHLLVATKQLLETLTQWSRGNAQEEEVSDVYVRLGYEFNLACRAFNSIGVETADLGPVPDLLRSILEDTLSQPASPQALDNYLPRIRDIIINLLHGLKRKQSKLRSKPTKDAASKDTPGRSQAVPPRQSSVGSVNSNETGLTSMTENVTTQQTNMRSESRQETIVPNEEQGWNQTDRSTIQQQDRTQSRRPTEDESSQHTSAYRSAHAMSTVPEPAPQQSTPSRISNVPATPDSPSIYQMASPPAKHDALSALQRGGDLERRASRRFSAYQISKHLGANGVPVIPPAQNSPIPNRGREVRESMSAVRSRTTTQSIRRRSPNKLVETTSNGSLANQRTSRISEERDEPVTNSKSESAIIDDADADAGVDSPNVKTPEEFEGPRRTLSAVGNGISIDTNVAGPPPSTLELLSQKTYEPEIKSESPKRLGTIMTQSPLKDVDIKTPVTTPSRAQFANNIESSPPSTKELTLFLQYKSKIKKFVLSEGYDELTIARLQLAFIEKFNWHTHNDGMELPEIYIQDPVSGVRHELEDLTDVKDRSVLVLNVEVLDEVKKHFDEGIGGLRTTLEGVKALIDGQGSMMQRFGDRQLESAKEMARLSAAPAPRVSQNGASPLTNGSGSRSESPATEVQNLRRDIAILRQTYSTMAADFASAMKGIQSKAEDVKSVAKQAAAPSYEGDAGRMHINAGKKTLNTESEVLVNRVDDLSDAVEDLRKDVVSRGVRPLPRQLEELSKEISSSAKDLAKMKEFLKREKPIWTKIWESELNLVCTERDDLTQQEELMADLDGDLQDVTNVFKLVEEATKQQNLQGGQGGLRGNAKLEFDTSGVDIQTAKDGVLGEVRALQPNHESRLEAIERAERIRQKELESRKGGEFQREVANFVEEGKLKKTGGMEEVERLRKIKDEKARKENFEREAQRKIERERERAEKAAAKAAAAAAVAATTAASEADSNPSALTEDSTPKITQDSSEAEPAFQDALETSASTSQYTDHDSLHPPDLPYDPASRLTPSPIKFDDNHNYNHNHNRDSKSSLHRTSSRTSQNAIRSQGDESMSTHSGM